MNFNTIKPIGEDAPNVEDVVEKQFPSFEEHMENMNKKEKVGEKISRIFNRMLHAREWAQHNTRVLTCPSLKNETLENGALRASLVVEGVEQKIKSGSALSAEEVINLATDTLPQTGLSRDIEPTSDKNEKISGFLEKIGIDGGRDFDVRLPGFLYNTDGKKEPTPLEVSFRDKSGDFVRTSFFRENGELTIVSVHGEREVADVGYDGPRDVKKEAKYIDSLSIAE